MVSSRPIGACMPRVAEESSSSEFSRQQLTRIVLGVILPIALLLTHGRSARYLDWTYVHRFCAHTRCNHLHLFVLCSVRTAREASSSAVYAVATLYILYCLCFSHPISCSPVMDPTKVPAPGVLFALPPPDMSVLNSTLGAILISGIVTSMYVLQSCRASQFLTSRQSIWDILFAVLHFLPTLGAKEIQNIDLLSALFPAPLSPVCPDD